MKTIVQISGSCTQVPGGANTILAEAGCAEDMAQIIEGEIQGTRSTYLCIRLEASDPRLAALFRVVAQYGLDFGDYRRDIYTDEELDAARLILMDPKPNKTIVGGTYPGTRYVLGAGCPACAAGVEQDSPLMIDPDDLPTLERSHVLAGHRSELIVDDGVKDELLRLNLKGVSFGSVYRGLEEKRQVKLPWNHVRPSRNLPKMSRLSTGAPRQKPCERCDRSGYMPVPTDPPRLVYRAEDVEDIDDVMFSWEWFGDVRLKAGLSKALLPYPWLFVTPRVMRVLRATGTEAFDWLPIRVVDSEAD